jgi:hypothetical protein
MRDHLLNKAVAFIELPERPLAHCNPSVYGASGILLAASAKSVHLHWDRKTL